MQALISVHDIMPATLADVRAIVERIEGHGLGPVTLLVVPGHPWRDRDLAQLQRWQQTGHELAGHGWTHRAERPRGWYHRLHAALLSRACGEHLSLTRGGIFALLERNHRWFAEQGLDAPELYVPPAWALGAIDRAALAGQPFAHIETLSGVRDAADGRTRYLPLVGFEADTALRATVLRAWNALARGDGPVRVAIHPADFRLHLRHDLARTLAGLSTNHTYSGWRRGELSRTPPRA
ncbi:MAG: polysaccharide deacetylase family protein [Halofilum sp. (in: g-proteobacteria)]